MDDPPDNAVTATWLGVTTLLFDDGETQILVDGFVSRPTLFESLTGRPVTSDAPMINYVMNEYGMDRLAAIVPAHSHYDHAMDVGAMTVFLWTFRERETLYAIAEHVARFSLRALGHDEPFIERALVEARSPATAVSGGQQYTRIRLD